MQEREYNDYGREEADGEWSIMHWLANWKMDKDGVNCLFVDMKSITKIDLEDLEI